MAKHRPLEAGVEDGSWFLEAVGARQAAPGASESLAELEHENAPPNARGVVIDAATATTQSVATIGSSGLDGDPGTSTSSFDPIPDLPTAPDGLFEPTPVVSHTQVASAQNPPDDSDDDGLSPALKTRRRFRWPAIVLLLLVIGVVGAAIVVVPNIQQQQALAVRQANYDAALAVRTHLPDTQIALDGITSPTSSGSEVADALPIITSLSNRGETLADAASLPLPVTFPIFAPSSMDNLATFTEQSSFLGADATEIGRRLSNGYVYRTSMPKLLTTGDIPTVATSNEISVLSVILASSLADDASLISDLPDDPAFQATVALGSSTLSAYTQWQSDYLAALSAQDKAAAEGLIGDLDLMRSDLAETTTTDLLGFRTEVDSRIVDLAGALDNHMENLSR